MRPGPDITRSAPPDRPGDARPPALATLAQHRLFFDALESTPMPMLVTDPAQPDNPVVFVNPPYLEMTGYARADVLGRNCRFMQGAATDPATVDRIRQAVRERRQVVAEILNYRKDGSAFWNALYVAPLFDADGNLRYFFASQIDVSSRKEAEAALVQAQKMEALGQLTGGISHDFNNLLQVLSGHLDLLDLKLERDALDAASARRSVAHARGAVAKAATLTQHLLAFSRKQRLENRSVDLNRAVDAVANLVRSTLGPGIELRTSLAEDVRRCRIDPTQFEVALLNILVNARDAMPDGGLVTIGTRTVRLDAGGVPASGDLPAGDYVCVSVRDSGGGIPPEILSRIMEPFFTTKEEGKGTGLGLSMVYGFVRQSGGSVDIDSEVGAGTTVRLYFPCAPEAEPPAPEPAHGDAGPQAWGGNESVLVVDDRAEVAATAGRMLRRLGYRVRMAHGAREALALLDRLPADDLPDLLFSDFIMPGGMNGLLLAREVRLRVPGIRILLTTGYAGEAVAGGEDRGLGLPVLQKPYRMDDLGRMVRAVLDGAPDARGVPES
jgi:PAS domain S-box-containing protein